MHKRPLRISISLKHAVIAAALMIATVLMLPHSIFAQTTSGPGGIINPAISSGLNFTPATAENGSALLSYIRVIWNTVQIIGGLLVLFYFILGGVDWITSHGEKGKVEAARNKMTQAVIGFIILISTFTIVGFLGTLIGFDFLRPVFLPPGATAPASSNKGASNVQGGGTDGGSNGGPQRSCLDDAVGDKCGCWCAGCGGFCGDPGVRQGFTCEDQQWQRCSLRPCWELGTCADPRIKNP
jgi:hypothetical protein